MIRNALFNREDPDKRAVMDAGTDRSYRELSQRAAAMVHPLRQAQRGVIAILLPNSADYISALFGVIMSGCTAFPLSTRLTVHELTALLSHTAAQAIITSRAYHSTVEGIAQTVPLRVIYVEALTTLKPCDLPAPEPVDMDETMILLATSGTTGNAKIVQLSERNVAFSTFSYLDKMGVEALSSDGIRMALGTPFSSVYGLMVLTACIIQSIPIVVLKDAFTLDSLYEAAQTHRITHFEGGVSVGLLMARLAGRSVRYDISSLCYFGLAGSSISADTLRRLMAAYPGVAFWPGYGMTEAGPLIAKPDQAVNPNKLDSVGTACNGVTVLVETDGVRTDSPNTIGEIVVKGPNVMLGYYKNTKETEKALKDGYLYTGDVGYLDEDGYLYICGRKKNVIIVRGFNVHAEEVEACLLDSGLVTDCVVYGATDEDGTELVCADVVPAASTFHPDDLRRHCSDRLADYKQPRRINLIDAIHKTATGKTARRHQA